MDNGWIKLHRKLLDSEIFASQTGLKIWLWCLLKASHKRRFIPIKIGRGETTITVDKGAFVFGRHSAERELNINGSTVYKWIQKIQDSGMINIESNSHYSIISICNYEDYQKKDDDEVTAIEQPSNNQVTATSQPRNTYKNVKNVKNDKKNTKSIDEQSTMNLNYEDIINFFNSKTKGVFGEVRYPISEKRKGMLRARIREHGKVSFAQTIERATASDFLKGQNQTGFKATFDWLIKPNNFQKTLEGNYDNRIKHEKTERDAAKEARERELLEFAAMAYGKEA